ARHPFAIDVRRVDAVKSRLDKAVEQPKGHCLVGRPSEYVAAKYQRCNLQWGIAEPALLHRSDFLAIEVGRTCPKVAGAAMIAPARSRSQGLSPFRRRLAGFRGPAAPDFGVWRGKGAIGHAGCRAA